MLQLLRVPQAKWGAKRVTVPCLFAKWKHSGGVDRHPSASFSIEPTGKSRYHCFSCNTSGDLEAVVYELRRHAGAGAYPYSDVLDAAESELDAIEVDVPDYIDTPEADGVAVWDEEYLKQFFPVAQVPVAQDFLTKRGVDPQLWQALELCYDPTRKRVCFPVRDWDGNLVGLRGRDITGEHDIKYLAYKYKTTYNPQVWYGESAIDYKDRLVLTEGVFDYASLVRVFPRSEVLCSFSCSIPTAQLERIKWAEEIVTIYDVGKGGDIARKAIEKYFDGVPVTHLVPTEEEDDAGGMTLDRVKQLYNST